MPIALSKIRISIRRIRLTLIALIVPILIPTLARVSKGDVIWIHGQETPIYGLIVAQSPGEVEFRIYKDGQPGKSTRIKRSKIEQMHSNIDRARLTNLQPDNPSDYADYAEELASQSADPTAHELARRLFLIASAHAQSGKDGGSDVRTRALTGLISLANSEPERLRIETLMYMVSPADYRTGTLASSTGRTSNGSPEEMELMLNLVHAIRKEDSERASALLGSAENRKVFEKWSETCSLAELDRIARVNRPDRAQLSKLLKIELQILQAKAGNENMPLANLTYSETQGWGDFAMQPAGMLSMIPSFENITSMDPRKSVYRNGAWQRPAAETVSQ